ncbi:MAG: CBS domain-containing protein [Pseudomonadota bacterium]|jgi:CBS domain-containing protein|nr:CBS domain-containing protein [Gammaproteobacteria bacterium]MBU1731273.1 CBS domain-containing protein [Gammaproteobacteria bacterium]MBU1892778.1 CBS domain-containing protein [Gammaproteobacteria bacterium]
MSVREILAAKKNVEIYCISPDQSIHEAVAIMTRHDIGSLVAKDGDKMVGLLTDHHIVRGLSKANCNLCNTLVRDVMVTSPIVGHPEDSVDQVRKVMTENHISHLPVEDENGLVGIISFYDVAHSALSNAEFENKLLKRYIKNWPEDEAE